MLVIRNAAGAEILNSNHRVAKFLGEFTVGGGTSTPASGYITDPQLVLGEFFYMVSPNSGQVVGTLGIPSVWQPLGNPTRIDWRFWSYGGPQPAWARPLTTIIYGVF